MKNEFKEFGYPEFNKDGIKVLTTYENEYRNMLMDIRVYRINMGDAVVFKKKYEETAFLLLKGTIRFIYEGNERTVSRRDVFTEGPWCLHICKDKEVKIIAESDSEVLVQSTLNEREFESILYEPKDAPFVYSSKGAFGGCAARQVNTIFDYDTAPYSNMVLGEVLNDRGNWSGYIPHTHPQPETYYFLFDRPEGFGASFVGDNVYKSIDGSFSAIPGGKVHPQVCAPGFIMYTCWMIRHLEGNPWRDRIDDERYTWLYDAEF